MPFPIAAGSYATIVKLARVALLAPIVALVTLAIGVGWRTCGTSQVASPGFALVHNGIPRNR